MFEKIINFFKSFGKSETDENKSKDTAKERLHLVLMQDRANVSADFLELMKQEIIEVIKKYIEVDEKAIDVRLTNKTNEDGTTGAPALYANIPITNIKYEMQKVTEKPRAEEQKQEEVKEEIKQEEKVEPENKAENNREEEKENIGENKEEQKEDNTEEVIEQENKEENTEKEENKA